jgi:N,N'-diacetyllegionaminate synthase
MKFNKEINIQGKNISIVSPTFIIAEAGVNHGGDIAIAKQLIDLAVDAKADAVKFQSFKAENIVLKHIDKAPYQKKTTKKNETQFDMLKKLEVTKKQNLELKSYCEDKNIIFLTTPYDEESLDELDELDLPAYKVASTDVTNLPLLKRVAKKGKPILLSTGMSYFSEVQIALECIYKYNKNVVLLQCTANYPIRDDEANLNVLNTFKDNFDILLGYSDHTVGSIGAAAFAIPMGVSVVEKHFTFNKSAQGPDHKASLSPDELKEFVQLVRKVDVMMGSSIKKPNLSETMTRASLQKCMVASCNLKKGGVFTEENIVAKRTGGKGISPIYYKNIIGKRTLKDLQENHILKLKEMD